jgi:pyruvate dehydrogenase E2 component (dihydrolipoamide acetyltransferase)
MATSVVMPALEMAQETGKIISWLKKEGEPITKGEALLEVETDKAVVEVEAPADGVLAGVKSDEGAVVPVGQTIAWIVAPGEQPPAETDNSASMGRAMTEQARPSSAAATTSERPSERSSDAGVRISPKARRLARERGVDITRLRGTGPDGAITTEDVMSGADSPVPVAAAASAPAPAGQASEPLSAIARLMAERTTQSWTQVPHFFLVREVDASALNEARETLGSAIERDRGVKLTHTDLLVALTARVLTKHPKMNAVWAGDGIRLNPDVNVSIAMAVKDGVVGAVIPNTPNISLAEIAVQRRDLTERARSAKLRPADLAGGTFTITNLGMYGIDSFCAIIVAPQAAILAVGRIADRVVPIDGKPGIRPILSITLSSDHRVVDGAQAAIFLNDLADAIGEPQKLLG